MAFDPNGNIFIGYRRKCSLWQAYVVYLTLSKVHNRDVYMDQEDESPGDFKDSILSLINLSTHYLLLLSPNTFKEDKEDDILQWEIKNALDLNRNIVHLWFDGFNWDKNKYHLDNFLWKKLKGLQGQKASSHNPLGDIEKCNDNLLIKKKKIAPKPITYSDQDKILSHAAGTAITNDPLILEPVSHIGRGRVNVYSLSEKLLSSARITIDSNIDFLGKLAKEHSEGEITKLTNIIPDVAKTISDTDSFNNTAKFIGLSPIESTQWLSNSYLPGLYSSMESGEFEKIDPNIDTDINELETPPDDEYRYNVHLDE